MLLVPKRWPGRWVGLMWGLPLFFPRYAEPLKGDVWFTLLDVGQGLSAVVRTAHHALVYDTGPAYPGGFDAGREVVVPYLREKGITAIDKLIVSHGDNDHIGGGAGPYSPTFSPFGLYEYSAAFSTEFGQTLLRRAGVGLG